MIRTGIFCLASYTLKTSRDSDFTNDSFNISISNCPYFITLEPEIHCLYLMIYYDLIKMTKLLKQFAITKHSMRKYYLADLHNQPFKDGQPLDILHFFPSNIRHEKTHLSTYLITFGNQGTPKHLY